MTLLELLTKARELISTPEKWSRNFSFEKNGKPVHFTDPSITHYTPWGALFVSNERGQGIAQNVAEVHRLADQLNKNNKHWLKELLLLNDNPNTTHAEVLQVFDDAIKEVSKS